MTVEPASIRANRINSDSLDWSYIGIPFTAPSVKLRLFRAHTTKGLAAAKSNRRDLLRAKHVADSWGRKVRLRRNRQFTTSCCGTGEVDKTASLLRRVPPKDLP